MLYDITPVAKVRMTQRDKFKNPPRPCVARFRAFKDECQLKGVKIPPAGALFVFYLPMPKSWSKKKKADMDGKTHCSVPDLDNLLGGVFDAVLEDDRGIWHIAGACKVWAYQGAIQITVPGDCRPPQTR